MRPTADGEQGHELNGQLGMELIPKWDGLS
jgi:hypothetical protein